MRKPMLSGHCATTCSGDPGTRNERCLGGQRANPNKEFQPCPHPCHFPGEEYECENCGGILKEAPTWPQEDPDYQGEPVYTHIDPRTGEALGEECP